jgi:phosphohistidine phosphatase
MIVYLVRHAWADWPPGQFADDERPITDEGRSRFRRMVKKLSRRGVAPATVATSPLVRCRETAEIVAERIGGAAIVELAALAPDGQLDEVAGWLGQQASEEIALVTHAPQISRWAAALIGGDGEQIRFGKGAWARIDFEGSPAIGQGELRWLVSAGLLNC